MRSPPTTAQRILQICEERKRRGMVSVILLMPSWEATKALYPPGCYLGKLPGGADMVLFDLPELLSVLRFMVEARR